MLCDFGSETLMTDEIKWKIRAEEGKSHLGSFPYLSRKGIWIE